MAAPPQTPTGPTMTHPDYANWSQFPVGTVVVLKSVAQRGESKVTSVETLRLLEKDDRRVIVERQNTTERNDGSYKAENPPEKRTYVKDFVLPPGMTEADFAKPSLKAVLKGSEPMTVLGKTVQCERYEWTDGTEAGPMKITLWRSNEIPGRIVKQLMIVEGTKTTTTDEIQSLNMP
jgi:hypothetical protein